MNRYTRIHGRLVAIESFATAEACVQHGGHCWESSGFSVQDAMLGGAHHVAESCKHCPAVRHGVSREPWEWTVHAEGEPT